MGTTVLLDLQRPMLQGMTMLQDIQQQLQQQQQHQQQQGQQLATITAHMEQQPDLNLLVSNVRGIERIYLCAMTQMEQMQQPQLLQMQQMQLLQHRTDHMWQLCAQSAAKEAASAAYRKQQQRLAVGSTSSSSSSDYVHAPAQNATK